MKITLRQLAVFDAVARLASVSGAAREVHLSQSAASLALQELERNLGGELFHRHRRKLALNENGRRLQPLVRSVLTLGHEIEGTEGSLSGVLRIAASPTIGNYVMPEICARFLAANPNVQLKLTVADEPAIIESTEDLAFDIGFIEGTSMRHMLMVEPWLTDELLVVASPSHWAAARPIAMSDLSNESWYLQPIGAATRHHFTQPYSALLGSHTIRFESNSIESIIRAVEAGSGVACLSRIAVADELRRRRLTSLCVKAFQITRTFKMIYRRDVYKGRAHAAFLEEARRAAGRDLLSSKSPGQETSAEDRFQ